MLDALSGCFGLGGGGFWVEWHELLRGRPRRTAPPAEDAWPCACHVASVTWGHIGVTLGHMGSYMVRLGHMWGRMCMHMHMHMHN
eukprot:1342202-Prymnesium_polylepis.1